MSFTRLEYYPALPGSCKGCGSSTRFPTADLGWSEEFHGAVYLCITCIEELCKVFDFIPFSTVATLTEKVSVLEAEILSLKYQIMLNQDVFNLLQPAIAGKVEIERGKYKTIYEDRLKETTLEIEKGFEDERQQYMDIMEQQLRHSLSTVISDYKIEQAKLPVVSDAQGDDGEQYATVDSPERDVIKSGSIKGSIDVLNSDIPSPTGISAKTRLKI